MRLDAVREPIPFRAVGSWARRHTGEPTLDHSGRANRLPFGLSLSKPRPTGVVMYRSGKHRAFAKRAVPPFDRIRTNGFGSPERQTRPFGHTVEVEGAGVRAEVPFAAPCSAQGTSVEGEHITGATSRSARACTGSAHAGALCRLAAQHLCPINQRKRKPTPEHPTAQHSTHSTCERQRAPAVRAHLRKRTRAGCIPRRRAGRCHPA